MLYRKRGLGKGYSNHMNQYDLDKLISELKLQGYSKQEINDYINELESEELDNGNQRIKRNN